MIRTFCAVLCAALAFPVLVLAETVSLRSADHAGFSRLVIDIPEGTNWEFGKTGAAYEFRSGIDDLTFDTSKVFVRMSTDRIARVVPMENGRLQVFVAENNHADVFELRDRQVVIDIKDGPPAPGSDFEVALTSLADPVEPSPSPSPSPVTETQGTERPVEASQQTLDTGLSGFDMQGLSQFGRTPVSIGPDGMSQSSSSENSGETGRGASGVLDTSVEREEFVRQLEQNLIEQIGRASADGLLVPALPDVEETQDIIENANAPTTIAIESGDIEPDVAMTQTESGSHLEIESATDRAQKSGSKSRRNFATDGGECIPTKRLDIVTWGLPLEEEFELPRLRAQLVDELDAPRQEGVLDLARYYLYLTYGAEARSVLSFLPEEYKDLPLLLVLADIFENSYAENSGPLLDQQSCDTAAALWSVMATKTLSKGNDYNRSAILAAFTVLPVHLRREIGPGLARRFADIGDTQTAAQIKSVFTRTAPLESTDVLLMDASIAASKDDFDTSDELVLEVVEKHAHEKPQTLIEFVKEQRARNGIVTDEVADTAEAIAVEYRHHELEEALVEASITARILTGDLDKALAQLKRAETASRVSESVAIDLRKLALAGSIESESDEVFVKAVFKNIDFIEAQMNDDNLLDGVSERLYGLGFDDAATRLGYGVRTSAMDEVNEDHRALVSGDWAALSQSENPNYATLAEAVVDQPSLLTEGARVPNLKQLETLLTDIKSKRESVLELLSK